MNIDKIITEAIDNLVNEADRHRPGYFDDKPDRHREGYWKERWAKQKAEKEKNGDKPVAKKSTKKKSVKKDRHKPGYYREYNKQHPERLERGFTKGYINGKVSNGHKPVRPNYPDGCLKDLGDGYYIDRLGWKRHLDPLTDALLRKEQEWHDDDWCEEP